MMRVDEVFINNFTGVEEAMQTIAYSTNTCNFFFVWIIFQQEINFTSELWEQMMSPCNERNARPLRFEWVLLLPAGICLEFL